jgi:DNA-binding response OmpR family regulator
MNFAILDCDNREVQWLEKTFASAGHSVRTFTAGSALARELPRTAFDAVVVGSTGADTCSARGIEELRGQIKSALPLICLLKDDVEADIVALLNAGADDCLAKTFRSQELLARVAAVMRRSNTGVAAADARLEMGALRIDAQNRLIFRDGERLTLTPKTYDLAVLLLTHTGQLLSRTYLLEQVWGRGRTTATRTLDTHVSRLRAMLGLTPENGWKLQSVYQHGYRLDQTTLAGAPLADVVSIVPRQAEACAA